MESILDHQQTLSLGGEGLDWMVALAYEYDYILALVDLTDIGDLCYDSRSIFVRQFDSLEGGKGQCHSVLRRLGRNYVGIKLRTGPPYWYVAIGQFSREYAADLTPHKYSVVLRITEDREIEELTETTDQATFICRRQGWTDKTAKLS